MGIMSNRERWMSVVGEVLMCTRISSFTKLLMESVKINPWLLFFTSRPSNAVDLNMHVNWDCAYSSAHVGYSGLPLQHSTICI